MNLRDLTKQQKQYVLLGGIVAAALMVLIFFGVKASRSSIGEAMLELTELNEKISSAEKSVKGSARSLEEFLVTTEELDAYLSSMPPDRNYYSWATELLYDEARMVDFEIDTIDEMMSPEASTKGEKDSINVELKTYSLRINARGGFAGVKGFLKRLSDHHPLVRVTGVDISTGSDSQVHNVQMFIEWPFDMNSIRELWKGVQSERAGAVTEAKVQ